MAREAYGTNIAKVVLGQFGDFYELWTGNFGKNA